MPLELSTLLEPFPRLAFAKLPSPVYQLADLGANARTPKTGINNTASHNVYVKHDGHCAQQYAGNKVRKLEFLLAQARQDGVKHVVTLGAAGSNHAVATSTYANKIGMRCTVCMTHQPPSAIATKNLRRHVTLGTRLHVYSRYADAVAHAQSLCQKADTQLIPLGGSSPLASLGYIAAAYELSQQINEGQMPCPDRIYVACGTMGTAVGLAVGFALLDLPIKIVAVRVTDQSVASPTLFRQLYANSVELLNTRLPNLHFESELKAHQFTFSNDFYGEAYAQVTPEALAAIDIAKEAKLTLDGTYTGKAFAALLADNSSDELHKPVLFWCTLNAVETPLADVCKLETLGSDFKRYF